MHEYLPKTLYWKLLKALSEMKDLSINLDCATGLSEALDDTLSTLKPTHFDDSYAIVRSGELRKYEDELSLSFSGCSCADECVDREAGALVMEAGRDKVLDLYGELVGAAESLGAACEEAELHIRPDTFVLGSTLSSAAGIELDHKPVPGFSSSVKLQLKEGMATIRLVDWNNPYLEADLDSQGEALTQSLTLSAKLEN